MDTFLLSKMAQNDPLPENWIGIGVSDGLQTCSAGFSIQNDSHWIL